MENISKYQSELLSQYSRSKNRIIFLDYDGTLAPYKLHPNLATPSNAIRELLFTLAMHAANRVVIISGREKENIENWLGDLPLTLVAEHGGFHKEPGQLWQSFFSKIPTWKKRIYPSLQTLVNYYKGSFIEEKYYSIAWHYRSIVDKIHERDVKQTFAAIKSLSTSNEFSVYDEDCTLELRTVGIDKGAFAARYVWNSQYHDFILAIGDGKTDEDLFEALGKEYFTIKVGKSLNSSARFFLDKQEDVLSLLTSLNEPDIEESRKFKTQL